MPWGIMLQSLINQTIQRSEHLQDRLEELESKRFTSSQAPLFLIELLSTLNCRICLHLAEFSRKYLPNQISYSRYEDLLDEVKSYANVLAQLYLYLGYVEASRVESNPPGIVSAIERISQIIVPDHIILICPSFRTVYEYHNLLSESNLRSDQYIPRIFDESIFRGRTHFAVLLYPFILRDDVLCHTLLIHELAHFICEVQEIFEKALPQRPQDAPTDLDDEDLKDFFIEYVTDLVAVYVLGPSFLFALIEFLTSIAGPADQFPSHPPLLLRIRNVLDTLRTYKQQFRPFIRHSAIAKKIDSFLKDLDSFTNIKTVPVDKTSMAIFKCLQPSLTRARRLIKNYIPSSLQFRPTHALFDNYVKWVEQGIPPSASLEDGKPNPLTLGEILNAVWLYRVVSLQDSVEISSPLRESEHTDKLRALSRLAQLAIRQNEALRLYKDAGI